MSTMLWADAKIVKKFKAIEFSGCTATAAFPPRRTACYAPHVDDGPAQTMRNATIRRVQTHGRYPWRVSSGATRQAVAENAMSRFKALFGDALAARRFDNQRAEGVLKCEALNRMTALGMPKSVRNV